MNKEILFILGIILGMFIGKMIIPESLDSKDNILESSVEPKVLECPADLEYIKNNKFICSEDENCYLLAEAIYFEARGESKKGMVAVAEVVINRVNAPYWPDTVDSVLSYRCQFEYRCSKYSGYPEIRNQKSWVYSLEIAELVYTRNYTPVIDNANHFLNTSKLRKLPRWTKVYQEVATIGNHTFYER